MNKEPIRLLLVEDNQDDALIVQRMLRRYERITFELETIATGDECLLRLQSKRFDVVVLDYGLPGGNGLVLLKKLKEQRGTPPVIMLTGQGDKMIASQALRDGAYDYLPKDSISSEILARTIHQTLEKHDLETRLIDDQVEGMEQIVFAMAAAAEAKDPTTEGHLRRMSRYAVWLGEALGFDERRLLILKYAGILHDIGKIGVSESVLRKPGELTPAEMDAMRQHPVIGEKICAPLRLSHELGPIIRHHHERWDGKGYVDGLVGEEAPLLARVISVVDAFDAMSSDRPYRSGLPLEEVSTRLREGAGSQWDPDITAAFLDLLRREGTDFLPALRTNQVVTIPS